MHGLLCQNMRFWKAVASRRLRNDVLTVSVEHEWKKPTQLETLY